MKRRAQKNEHKLRYRRCESATYGVCDVDVGFPNVDIVLAVFKVEFLLNNAVKMIRPYNLLQGSYVPMITGQPKLLK